VRSNFNRQTRRAALCIGDRRPVRRRRATSPISRIWLAAYGRDLARIAERIAGELVLPAELSDLLSPACVPTSMSVRDRWALTGEVSER
jgi:hypothetical protein